MFKFWTFPRVLEVIRGALQYAGVVSILPFTIFKTNSRFLFNILERLLIKNPHISLCLAEFGVYKN